MCNAFPSVEGGKDDHFEISKQNICFPKNGNMGCQLVKTINLQRRKKSVKLGDPERCNNQLVN